MRLKYKFVVSSLGGKPVAVSVGRGNERFNGMITQEELLSRFAAHFGITKEMAKPAVLRFLDELRQGGLLEETV